MPAETDLVEPRLRTIAAYDARHGTALINTLRVVLDTGGRALAAAELGIHPNTLRYRLGRIRTIGEIDLDDRDERPALMVQLRLFTDR